MIKKRSPAQPSPPSSHPSNHPGQPQFFRPNIGPRVQNQPKSTQIRPTFRVVSGSPFVHLPKFHRFSASFFGAHLFCIAIWTHNTVVSSKLGKMLPRYAQIWFSKNGFWSVLGRHGSVWLENRCIRTQIALRTSFPKIRPRFWPNFGAIFCPWARDCQPQSRVQVSVHFRPKAYNCNGALL